MKDELGFVSDNDIAEIMIETERKQYSRKSTIMSILMSNRGSSFDDYSDDDSELSDSVSFSNTGVSSEFMYCQLCDECQKGHYNNCEVYSGNNKSAHPGAQDIRNNNARRRSFQSRGSKIKLNYYDKIDKANFLPEEKRVQKHSVKSSDFLKLHRMKNPVHDGDRENAISIAKNITVENLKKVEKLNEERKKRSYYEINLNNKELYSIGQLSEQELLKNPTDPSTSSMNGIPLFSLKSSPYSRKFKKTQEILKKVRKVQQKEIKEIAMIKKLKDTLAEQAKNKSHLLRKDTQSTIMEEEEDNISICGYSRRSSLKKSLKKMPMKISGIKIPKFKGQVDKDGMTVKLSSNEDQNSSLQESAFAEKSILSLQKCDKNSTEKIEDDDLFYSQIRPKSKSELLITNKQADKKSGSFINLISNGISPLMPKKKNIRKSQMGTLVEEDEGLPVSHVKESSSHPYISDFPVGKNREIDQRRKANSLKKVRPYPIRSNTKPISQNSEIKEDLINHLYDNGFKNYKMKLMDNLQEAPGALSNAKRLCQSSSEESKILETNKINKINKKPIMKFKVYKMLPKVHRPGASIKLKSTGRSSVKSNFRSSGKISQNSDLEGILKQKDSPKQKEANFADKFSHKIALILHQKMREEHLLKIQKPRKKSSKGKLEPAEDLEIEKLDKTVISQKFQELFGDILNIAKSDDIQKNNENMKEQDNGSLERSGSKTKKNLKNRKIIKNNIGIKKLPRITRNKNIKIGSSLKIPKALQARRNENSSVPVKSKKKMICENSLIKLNKIETKSDDDLSTSQKKRTLNSKSIAALKTSGGSKYSRGIYGNARNSSGRKEGLPAKNSRSKGQRQDQCPFSQASQIETNPSSKLVHKKTNQQSLPKRFKKFDKLSRKIQKRAEELKDLNFDKYLEKYKEGLNLQNKINDIIDDQMFNIQALRERMRSAIEDSSFKTIQIINPSESFENDSFTSDSEFNRELDDSVMYQKFITGYDHIFLKKVKGWNKDYIKDLQYNDLKIKKCIPEKFKKKYLRKLKYKK
ncbi:unnamed protein product [Moneuplotes crassus]|uniref:Uncharacterized protein n=1 Tax=Euplotes crassus TaxID=5936 RepID=A0AAD1X3N6_EUPCR|nr:unnamed protein product [Moneuplotes crassus]